jgi:hypothetical protein
MRNTRYHRLWTASMAVLAGMLFSLSMAAGAVPPPDPPVQLLKVAASDPQTNDVFGEAVAVDGDTLVVGAPFEDGGPGDPLWNAGAVYVYERHAGGSDNWGQVARLAAGDPGSGDYFGISVAISGDTIAVGAPYENGGPGNPISDAGAVYLFERDQGGPGAWGQLKKIMAGDSGVEDDFGLQLALDGDTLVVAAPGENGGPGDPLPGAGAVYILERDHGGAGNWGEVAKLMAGDAESGDVFGSSVAIDGDTLVAGAAQKDGGPTNLPGWAGAAYVFERDDGGAGNWGEVKQLLASDAGDNDRFGSAVTIEGDTIIVGAPFEQGGPGDPYFVAGAAYVFERDAGGPGNWGEVKKLSAGDQDEGDYFAFDLDLQGDVLVVGAANESGGPGDPLPNAGAVYVLERNEGGAGNWGQVAKVTAEDALEGDRFGTAVALSGELIFIGAGSGDADGPPPVANSGVAYIFGPEPSEPEAGYLLYLPLVGSEG